METLEAVKVRHVLAVLAACNWSPTRAAEVLGVCHKTVYNWLAAWAEAGRIRPADNGRGWELTEGGNG